MKLEIDIISEEHIKPSSPTPPNLRIHKLCLFDQIAAPIWVPIVLYFSAAAANNSNIYEHMSPDDFISKTTQVLKQSLSATLNRFYPLAGRVRDHCSIDCNDDGILFKVAKIRGVSLTGFLKNPDPASSRAHIPLELNMEEPGPGSYVSAAQLNYFECGGLALGLLFRHKIMDGVTTSKFMKCWAAVARDSAETIEIPDYTSPSLFPHNESMKKESHLFSAFLWYIKSSKTVMRRYVFDSKAISELRAKLTRTSPDHHQLGRDLVQFRPSRVESVSALIWKCFMQAAMSTKSAISKSNETSSTVSLLTHNVDMRRRVEPALPELSFGNFVWLVPASCSYDETHHVDMTHLARKLHEAISRVDNDFVKRMQGADGFSGYERNLEETWDEFPKNADYMRFTSWCNFGFYRLDFGWGTPVWLTKCDAGNDVVAPYLNICWLTDTRHGDGIEAWVNLEERYAAAFNSVEELQALASIDPSPLDSL